MYSQVPKNTLEYKRPIKSRAKPNKQTGVCDITRAKLASINPSHDNYSSKLIYVTQRRRLSSKWYKSKAVVALTLNFSFEEIFCTLNAFLGSNDFLDLQGLQRHVRSVSVFEGFYFF